MATQNQLVLLQKSIAENDQAMAAKDEELKIAVARRDKASAEAQTLRNTLRQEAAQLTSKLTSARSMVTSLEKDKAELDSKVTQLASQPSAEQTRLNESQAVRIKELQGKLESSQSAQQQAATLAQSQSEQIQKLDSKFKALEQQLTEAEKKTAEAQNAAAMAKPAATLQADPAMQAQIDSLQAKLDAQADSVAEHQRLKSEMAAMQVRHADQLKELLAAQSGDRAPARTSKNDPGVADLKAELQAQEKRIMQLESENHEAHEKLAAMLKQRAKAEAVSQPSPAKSPRAAKKKALSGPKPSSAKEKRLAEPANSNNKSQKDDLTRVVGIGKVFQGKLNKIGVTSFEQIAAWSKKDATAIEDQLKLGGRITNEKWINQAKALAKEKNRK